jgi:hypothetical protein
MSFKGPVMRITDIKSQPLGLVLDSFCICQSCHIVDTDIERVEVGHPCSTCGEPSPSGRSFFGLPVYSLINLMQVSYHSENVISQTGGLQDHYASEDTKLAVVIFFVALREVLMTSFLKNLMIARDIPEDICERLFEDNPTHTQRMNKLFHSLTGQKWKKAIKILDGDSGIDYANLDKFIEDTVNARNTFLHKGIKWAVGKDMVWHCLERIPSLLRLHVDLHNKYVYPLYNNGRELITNR